MAEKERLEVEATPLAVPEQPVGRSALFLGLFRPLRQLLLPYPPTGSGRIGCPRLSALGFEHWLFLKKKPPKIGWFFFGGEGGTRTLAPVTRPTPLAGAPRHQLEYFSIDKRFFCYCLCIIPIFQAIVNTFFKKEEKNMGNISPFPLALFGFGIIFPKTTPKFPKTKEETLT